MVVAWAIDEKGYSQRRACTLIGIAPKTYRYASSRGDDTTLRERLSTLAGERRRFGYRRLHILLGARVSSCTIGSCSGFTGRND
jgi:putative transposase